MTFGEGSDCWPITCIISQEHLRTICPSQNLQDHVPEWLNCKSDCRTHVAHELCCTGPWDSPECKPSSPYFSQACPAAYAWPHDDGAAHYQACHPHGEVALRLRQR
jgi:Thaumatin family